MSWPIVSIGEVCEIVSGATPKTKKAEYWDGDIPWVTPKDLSGLEQKYIEATSRSVTVAGLKSCSARMLPVNSVLFSSRAPIGLVAINSIPVCTNQGFKSLVPRNGVASPDYLYWWMKTHRAQIQQKGRGATFKEVSKKIVERIEIPLPPLDEQKRIARILDAADALRARRRESLAQLETLLQSTFLDMFGDPRSGEGPHPVVPLSAIAEVRMGQSPPGSTYNSSGKGTPLLNGPTEFGARFPKEIQWTTSPTKLCKPGDIVFCVRGATAGRLNEADKEYCLGRGVAAIRGTDRRINQFIYSVLKSLYDHFQSQGVGSTFINISRKDLETLPFPNPPLALQLRFASIAEGVEHQKSRFRAYLAELDNLFSSLQTRAFRGEL